MSSTILVFSRLSRQSLFYLTTFTRTSLEKRCYEDEETVKFHVAGVIIFIIQQVLFFYIMTP